MKRFELALAAVLVFSLTACQTFMPTVQHPGAAQKPVVEMAPVKISLSGLTPGGTTAGFNVQAVPTYLITQARVEVTGPGMAMISQTVAIDANGHGTVSLNVPMGRNRVFTAIALKTDNSPVPGAVVGAVKTIEPGANAVNLTWTTTATAEAFTDLLANDAAMASSTDISKVQTLVNGMLIWGSAAITTPLSMHPSLVDGVKIGQYMRANGGAVPLVSVNYVKPHAMVSLKVNGLPAGFKYDAWIEDPASRLLKGVASDLLQSFGAVHEGTWTLHIITLNATNTPEKRIQESLTVVNGVARDITIDLAGPSNANLDFSHDDADIPTYANVPALNNGTEYVISGN
ncbi:hypothetical protein D3C87_927180 [compost metagenome]